VIEIYAKPVVTCYRIAGYLRGLFTNSEYSLRRIDKNRRKNGDKGKMGRNPSKANATIGNC